MVNNSTNIYKRDNHLAFEIIDNKNDHNIWYWKSRSLLSWQRLQNVAGLNYTELTVLKGYRHFIQRLI